jgi:hypothetical protein
MTDAVGAMPTLDSVTGLSIRCADSLKAGFDSVITTDRFQSDTDRVGSAGRHWSCG